MIPTQIEAHLYQLLVPTPFPVGPVNAYLADGPDEPLTLIDTGPPTEEARAALSVNLAALGYRLAEIERVIITHAHTDHYGLVGEIVQMSGASVYSHPYNHAMLQNDSGERERRSYFYTELLAAAGVPVDVQQTLAQILGANRYKAAAIASPLPLEEGDRLRLAGKDWQVLFLPGHASGLVCLYQPETQLLLSSDHLLRDISSNPLFEPPPPGHSERRRSLVDYIASLKRTAGMEVTVAWPGHGEPIYAHRELIEQRLAFHAYRAGRIMEALRDSSRTMYELGQIIFSNLGGMNHFLAISEILAHLEWLEVQGKVVREPANGEVRWKTHNASCVMRKTPRAQPTAGTPPTRQTD